MCEEVIEKALHKYGIKRDRQVCQLYLAKRGLTYIPDLSRFQTLTCLWLNNNKIKDISYKGLNCCLTELYLQNNNITSISGTMSHLACLRVLLLHINQMKRLDETVAELRNIHHLHTVTFFLNPFAQEPEYRQYVLHHLPSVQILDRRVVKQEERNTLFQLFNTEQFRVLQSLAFGRRIHTPVAKETGSHVNGFQLKGSDVLTRHINRLKCPFDDIADPSVRRAMQRSVMQFSSVDWRSFPTAQQSQLGEYAQPHIPNILKITFR
ncbi:leucine-rich repeat-containing protein 72 [Osmerus mordax]|uniref:leucine-rich repeat-containing protein 72 n=1 Tax=Osmerus mordax TaxID=8014 RepID=UPI003510431B